LDRDLRQDEMAAGIRPDCDTDLLHGHKRPFDRSASSFIPDLPLKGGKMVLGCDS
jgi:hypothetical protein